MIEKVQKNAVLKEQIHDWQTLQSPVTRLPASLSNARWNDYIAAILLNKAPLSLANDAMVDA